MLSICKISSDNRSEARVLQKVAAQSIQRGSPARDSGSKEASAGLENSMRFSQGASTPGRLGEVVEWPQQKHDIGASIGKIERPGVSHARGRERPTTAGASPLRFGD
jgi:hypothetical protein